MRLDFRACLPLLIGCRRLLNRGRTFRLSQMPKLDVSVEVTVPNPSESI